MHFRAFRRSLRDLHMASAWVTTLRNAIKAYQGLTATNE